MDELEQQRRDLMQENRKLYNYIVWRELSKAFDSFGDRLSGFSHEAANLAWSEAARYRTGE